MTGLGINIMHERKKKRLWLSQEKYIEKFLDMFNMKDSKGIATSLGSHFKLSIDICPHHDKENEEMRNNPYALVVGSSMYAMVCT